jgi:membrane fusion protein (multidrug efflux system)
MSTPAHAEPAQPKPRRVLMFLSAVAIGAVLVAFSGLTDRARSRQEVMAWTNEQAIPSVHLVQPEQAKVEQGLTLPGNVSAFYSGSLFARASGYVAEWRKDIGAQVKKGEILAVISAPDLDQQLAEAKGQLAQLQAAVEQAQANSDLGKVTDQRTAQLVTEGWSSKQQGDTDHLTAAARVAAVTVAKANVIAQQAAVGRLQELVGFEQVRAPFDGVITARNVDIGDLLSAGGNTGKPMFQVADIHRVRIYVNVPQGFLGELSQVAKTTLKLPGLKDTFAAEMVSTSNSLAPNSRTALIELQADNPDGKLLPGAFAEVHFHVPAGADTLSVPLTALVFGAKGMQVAAVDGNNQIALKPVQIGRNLGNRVEIESGLSLADHLVDNPPESMQTGDIVRVAGADPTNGAVASDIKHAPAPAKDD